MTFDGNNIIAYLAGLIPVGAYLLKLFIDNWKATDLEKIMMSNFKKFQLSITKYLLIGLAFVAFFYTYLTIVPPTEMKDMESFILIIFLIVIFTFAITAFFLLDQFIVFLFNTLSFKFDYYVVNDENEAVFRVIKLSDKNHLLVESDGIEEFIENPKTKRYKKERKENDTLNKLYKGNKMYIILPLISLMCLSLIIWIFKTTSWKQFILYLLLVLLLFSFLVLLFNFIFERKANKQQEQEEHEEERP